MRNREISKDIQQIKNDILEVMVQIEASIDYPEYDVEEVTNNQATTMLENVKNKLTNLQKTFHNGKILISPKSNPDNKGGTARAHGNPAHFAFRGAAHRCHHCLYCESHPFSAGSERPGTARCPLFPPNHFRHRSHRRGCTGFVDGHFPDERHCQYVRYL